ncbi:DUF4227 family protein [Paenibacillus aestuarii]|uniref:DUF4227 family protein n=1 Tax=Paenibacillus aestuarii TaxID=516965 RepID=A0ABW0K603_9BACL|nr:DUF4227 family protein [Paenibacillus aestuarii]
MVFSTRKWISRLRFIFMFMTLTIVLYQVMVFLAGWIQPMNKYKTPTGKSVKVFGQHSHPTLSDSGTSMGDRLRLFYWYGE